MITFVVTALLALFIIWGAVTAPGRPFSWAMYSGSSRAFLWTDHDGGPRVPGYDEMRLAPDSHSLSLPDLCRLIDEGGVFIPVQGLIIGSRGSWQVAYDGARLSSTPVPEGEELGLLAEALQRLERAQP